MTRLLQIGAIAFGGVIASFLVGFGSVYALGGAGHGWCSSVWSFLTVLFVPVLCVGFIEHEPRRLRHLTWYVGLGCLATDGVLLVSTCMEGWSAVARVWKAVPWFLVGWITVWLALHAVVSAFWLRGIQSANKALHATASAPSS
jgi:hypothetical protein